MKLENSINYYYTVLALRLLLERGLISEDEYGKICRYNAEVFKPGREYIWPHWVWTSAQPQPRIKRDHAMGAARREPRGG